MSSIFSTSACGVGTQTTSLPGWPDTGSNGLAGACAPWANALAAARKMAADRTNERNAWLGFILYLVKRWRLEAASYSSCLIHSTPHRRLPPSTRSPDETQGSVLFL